MNCDINGTTEQWFDSTFLVLNESYQLDLRRILSPDSFELIHSIGDYYLYDQVALFLHLLGVASHYLTPTSFVYADNQLKHNLNLHILLVARSGFERSSLIDHIKQCMINVHCLRQNIQPVDIRSSFHLNLFCRSDETNPNTAGFCLSDRFDEHSTPSHLQNQKNSSSFGISNGHFIRQLLEKKFHGKSSMNSTSTADCLMYFVASKARLYCRRLKIFDPNRYPSLEKCIIIINSLCSTPIDFYFDDPQANQFMCDYLDALTVKAVSLEERYPWMAARYLQAHEHVLRIAASLRLLELAIEMLIIYKRTFHSFAQMDKLFFENCLRLLEQTRGGTSSIVKLNINATTVQSAIYLVNTSIKQFEIMFEPNLNGTTINADLSGQSHSAAGCDRSWTIHSSSSSSSTSFVTPVGSPPLKRTKPFIDPSYVKSLELAHELLLLPYVAFTRTSLYGNSKLKRNAAYLDFVIDELKKHQLLILVRQGVQMVDGTRRRVDLLVKSAPIYKHDENENNDKQDQDLFERLNRFGVDYDRYIQTLSSIDIGEKYRLSDQCFDLLNSAEYKKFLTINLEKIAPLSRFQQNEEIEDRWTSPSSPTVKIEPADLFV